MAKAPIILAQHMPDTGRRSFLTRATVVAAGGLFLGSVMPLPGHAGDDIAVLAAIDTHRQASVEVVNAVHEHSNLDETLPDEKTRSSIDNWGEKIVETDDPRWIASERRVDSAWDAQTDAACLLCDTPPATIGGLFALVNYIVEAEAADKDIWPSNLVDENDRKRSFHYFLLQNIGKSLGTFNGGTV